MLSMGDDEARSMGVKTESLKFFIIACTTSLPPRPCLSADRGLGGAGDTACRPDDFRPESPLAAPDKYGVGAVFLLVVDDIARTATPLDIPIGILTGLIGAPFFAYLLRRTKGGWK